MTPSNNNWNNKNQFRDYPFYSNDSTCRIDEQIIADLFLCIRANNSVVPYLAYFFVGKGVVSVGIGDLTTGNNICILQCAKKNNQAGVVSSLDDYVIGNVTFGSVENLTPQYQEFEAGKILLVPHCYCNIGAPPILSLSSSGNYKKFIGDTSIDFRGDIIVTTHDSLSSIDGGTIRTVTLSLDNQKRYQKTCANPTTQCECALMPIRSINGVQPNPASNQNIDIEINNSHSTIIKLESLSGNIGFSLGKEGTSSEVCPPRRELVEFGQVSGVEDINAFFGISTVESGAP